MPECYDAEEFFETIAPDDEDDICEIICCTIAGDEGMDTDNIQVAITDTYHLNISNIEAQGFLTYKGEEYAFVARSGDQNGFEFIEFSSEALDYEPYNPRTTVMPQMAYRCAPCNAKTLLDVWDTQLKLMSVADALQEHMSCRYTNSSTSKVTENLMTVHGLEVVDGETADHYREKLNKLHVVYLLKT